MTILFPSQPFSPSKVEPDFAEEFDAARTVGFQTAFYDHDLIEAGEITAATKSIPLSGGEKSDTLLRGWMLTGENYGRLHEAICQKGHRPLVSPEAYEEAHYLPLAYQHIAGECARAGWIEGDDIDRAWELYSREFAGGDCVIKDWVKSAKAKWKEGCFIPQSTSKERFAEIYKVFRTERGKLFNRGVVLREFLPIVERGSDIRGLPLVEEVRLFFWRGSILVPPIGRSPSPIVHRDRWETIASRFRSPFITIDVAYLADGSWAVVEVGDGGVSGLPLGLDAMRFYSSLWNATMVNESRSGL